MEAIVQAEQLTFTYAPDKPPVLEGLNLAIEPGSYMHGIAKCNTMLVNSFHHQALNTIGDGLKVSARALDGVVEAVENADGSVFAVQWHPELLYAENPEHRAIFETFVNRCAAK